ncbi:MAG TPA: alpha/beta hydrolase [Mycobacterium sp.]|nr:alpha/beta hydrolase [Mycobacterium sp.]
MRKLLAALAIGASAVAARRYWATRDALAAVPAEFRSPLLPLLAGDVTARGLRWARRAYGFRTRPGPGVRMTERRVDGRVPALVFTPSAPAGRRPGILYLHGGGMIVGSPHSEALGSGRLAREVDAVVVSPDYRLAPEHPFPAALDDCMATLHWMRDSADELDIDPDRIAVTGSSAGGGLSAAVAQRAYDEGMTLRAQVLVYPMIDDRTVLRDDHNGRSHFLWTPRSNRFGWTSYLGRPPRLSDAPEYAAPARRADLSGLAPAWVGVGSLDLFYDESVDYAERLKAAGVECELVTVAGMYHGADGLARKDPAMKAFRRGVVEHLQRYLSPPSSPA